MFLPIVLFINSKEFEEFKRTKRGQLTQEEETQYAQGTRQMDVMDTGVKNYLSKIYGVMGTCMGISTLGCMVPLSMGIMVINYLLFYIH